MDIKDVIKIRDILKADKNLPVVVHVDNTLACIDESAPFQFTKWDDVNGILYSFRLPNANLAADTMVNRKEICLYATTYENIQAIELCKVSLDNVEDVIEKIKESGVTFSDDFKNYIIGSFENIFNPSFEMTNKNVNLALGTHLDESYDYYNGKYRHFDKETNFADKRNTSVKEESKDDGK